MINMPTNSNMLFSCNAISRGAMWGFSVTDDGMRVIYKISAALSNTPNNNNKNTPRAGSFAKVCAEINIPERTRNVPSKLSAKQMSARNAAHAMEVPRFSAMINTCINAVPVNQGKSDAFSTGSQNQNPPQPNTR